MIKILSVGKIKEPYLNQLINDYLNRIKKYHKIEIIEVKDEATLDLELIHLKKHLSTKDYLITLEIEGKTLSSEEFASKIEKTFLSYPNITFVIGSSLGIPKEIKEMSNFALSFSSLTFPHGLFRGILLEQIYRAFKIINNETYHK